MRIVYMGTPQLAASILTALNGHQEIVGVFTRPDAIRGRGKKLVASPVKETACELGLPVYTPSSFKDEEAVNQVKSLAPDVICVVAYGCILPKSILDIPEYGCLNVHTSLLPRWRGAAPIERSILADDDETGVCIMRVEEGLDTGPYCVRDTLPIAGQSLAELTSSLSELGSAALIKALELVEAGTVEWCPQGELGLTYADKIGKSELDFTPDDSTALISAKVRASNDSHPSKIQVAGKTIAVERVRPLEPDALPGLDSLKAGETALIAKRLVIGAPDGALELEQVKPDGKKSMEGRAFASGLQGIKNDRVTWGKA